MTESPYLNESDLRLQLADLGLLASQVEAAIVMARRVHEHHRRDDGSPYLEEHVFPVAFETAEYLASRVTSPPARGRNPRALSVK